MSLLSLTSDTIGILNSVSQKPLKAFEQLLLDLRQQ